jgi:hypothetical protein
MATPFLSMLGTRDHQAPSPYNVEKVLDTINNLMRVLELMLTLSIPPTIPPPAPTPAAVILPKATMLGSGLDQVSPQHASNLHSKVLMDHITNISSWAASACPLKSSPQWQPPTISPVWSPPSERPPPSRDTPPHLSPLAWAHQQALQQILTPTIPTSCSPCFISGLPSDPTQGLSINPQIP